MTRQSILVVGGTYFERCMKPQWKEIYGSAGRAASAISSMGGVVDLHSYCDNQTKDVIESRGALENFRTYLTPINKSVSFDYHHGLDTPRICIPQKTSNPLRAEGECVVRFGMLEGDAIVKGNYVVYDPQNPLDPIPFHANGSTANKLAIVLNRYEASLLSGLPGASVNDMALALIKKGMAQVVIIKLGAHGVLVHDGKNGHTVSAYRSERVWKIGSGDNFVAHFAFRWMGEGRSAVESADLASKATAYYCQNMTSPTYSDLNTFSPNPIVPSNRYKGSDKPTVYLAGPFFTLSQLWVIEQARENLREMGLKVFSPYHDVGYGSSEDVVPKDLAGIDASDLVFAVADGLDSGTIYEIGYARAKDKPVIVYCENESEKNMKMIQGSGCMIYEDYVSGIYQALWKAVSL